MEASHRTPRTAMLILHICGAVSIGCDALAVFG